MNKKYEFTRETKEHRSEPLIEACKQEPFWRIEVKR